MELGATSLAHVRLSLFLFAASVQTVWHFLRLYVHKASQSFCKYMPWPPHPHTRELYLHEHHAEDLQSEHQE